MEENIDKTQGMIDWVKIHSVCFRSISQKSTNITVGRLNSGNIVKSINLSVDGEWTIEYEEGKSISFSQSDKNAKLEVLSLEQAYDDGRKEIWSMGDNTGDGKIVEFKQNQNMNWYALTDTPSEWQKKQGSKNGWSYIFQLKRAEPTVEILKEDPATSRSIDKAWRIVVISGIILVGIAGMFVIDDVSDISGYVMFAVGIFLIVSKEVINSFKSSIDFSTYNVGVYEDDDSKLEIDEKAFWKNRERTPENLALWEKEKEVYFQGKD